MPHPHDREYRRLGVVLAEGVNTDDVATVLAESARYDVAVELIASHDGEVQSVDSGGLAERYPVNVVSPQAHGRDYDAVLVPDGCSAQQQLNQDPHVVELIHHMLENDRTLGLSRRTADLLIAARGVGGRRVTSTESLCGPLMSAGAVWLDDPVVIDRRLITTQEQSLRPLVRHVLDTLTGSEAQGCAERNPTATLL